MLEMEKQCLFTSLNQGREALGRALHGVDEELAGRKPPNNGWSILECVEHCVISERYLLSRLRVAQHTDEPVAEREREAKIAARAANRARRIEAPPQSTPKGEFATLGKALAAFDATRADTVVFLGQFSDDLRRWSTDHPLFPGPVTCYETVIMMAAHPGRHAEQILEIREAVRR
jgi:DinB superfamily